MIKYDSVLSMLYAHEKGSVEAAFKLSNDNDVAIIVPNQNVGLALIKEHKQDYSKMHNMITFDAMERLRGRRPIVFLTPPAVEWLCREGEKTQKGLAVSQVLGDLAQLFRLAETNR